MNSITWHFDKTFSCEVWHYPDICIVKLVGEDVDTKIKGLYHWLGRFYDEVVIAIEEIAIYGDISTEDLQSKIMSYPLTVDHDLGSIIEVPIDFDKSHALNWQIVELHTNMSFEAYADAICDLVFETRMMGFLPGFAYHKTLPLHLQLPRLDEPHTSVPSGSLAVGHDQIGIYPLTSPGGWNIIGKCAIEVWDKDASPPSIFSVGGRVKFVNSKIHS